MDKIMPQEFMYSIRIYVQNNTCAEIYAIYNAV